MFNAKATKTVFIHACKSLWAVDKFNAVLHGEFDAIFTF